MVANLELAIPKKVYTGVAGRILKLICAGVEPTSAAAQVGCDVSYVNALCREEQFQLQVQDALKEGLEEAIEIDKNYRETEKLLSKRLKDLVAMDMNIDRVARVLKTVNGLVKHVPVINGNDSEKVKREVVTLVIPQIVHNTFVVNPNQEVISIDNRDLVTLNSSSIDSLVAKKHKEIEQQKLLEDTIIHEEVISRPQNRNLQNLKHHFENYGKDKQQMSAEEWDNL